MKAFKKIFAIAMALALICTFCLPAFAETPPTPDYSITVTGAQKGETYTAYKMFDLVVDSETEPKNFSYTVNSAWLAFFKTGGDGAKYIEIDEANSNTTTGPIYVTAILDSEGKTATDSADLAKAAAKYVATASPALASAGSVTPDADGEAKIVLSTTPKAGYYLITSTNGTIAMIDTTPDKTAVKIEEKNADPTIEKTVTAGGTAATTGYTQIGDTVTFTITVHAKKGAKGYVVTDKMAASTGLTFNNDVVVKVGGSPLTINTDYTLATTGLGTGETFKITFNQTYLDKITAATDIVITYTAKVNKGIISNNAPADQKNSAALKWGTAADSVTADAVATVKTSSITVTKYDADDATNKTPIAGAVFTLKKGDSVVGLIKISDTVYRTLDATENNTTTGYTASFTTVAGTAITILGLDSDLDAYTLTEDTAPKGYNKLKDPVTIATSNNTFTNPEIANQAGSELPSTGALGTTLLITLGSVLFVLTAVVLVTKKRMYNEG